MKHSFLKLIRSFQHEGFLICLLLAGFLIFPRLSRSIDVTSAPLDPGILSIILVAPLAFLSLKAFTWWAIRIIWPVFADYSENLFEDNFRALTPLQKVLIYLAFYMALLLGMVITLAALM